MEESELKLQGTAAILPNGHLTIGACDTIDLAKRFGTPLWVLDEAELRRNCRSYVRAFNTELFPNGAEVTYAGKALLTLAVCKIIKEEGLSLDVVSGGELYAALAAGFPPERICFHGNNKSRSELAYSLEAGVGRIMVDNEYELELLEALLGEKKSRRAPDLILRLSPGVEPHDTHDFVKTGQLDSKFGFSIDDGAAEEVTKRVLDMGRLNLRGFHCHIGSQIHETEPFVLAADILMDFAAAIRDATGWTPADLDLGGGFGIRYTDEDVPLAPTAYAEAVAKAVREKADELGLPMPKVIVEPGRAISATAGWTLYTIGALKRIPGIRTYVSIDGGMPDNPRFALYGAKYEACIANRAAESVDGAGRKAAPRVDPEDDSDQAGGPSGRPSGSPGLTSVEDPAEVGDPADLYTVAGKCCESGDVIIRDIALPDPVPGEILAVSCTGAYNHSMSMNYNRLPRPAMVLVRDGQADVILERETYDDLLLKERMPARLAGGQDPRRREGEEVWDRL